MSNTDSAGAQWRKSSRSGGAQKCVEVATNLPGWALVRDSKLGAASPILRLSPEALGGFLDAIKDGRYDG
ncbi:DUF397 domain-containing protein [Saccharopolyspora cebuensis]|uniref:DUF397 domain-containing protein n=1 Tax=Saccharopolyspora cebuensis TaxID=418759 RepID=A0ABV4CI06_9PSEU